MSTEPNTYSTEQFSYSAAAGTFVADFTDLNPRLDLNHEKITLVSHVSGNTATYTLRRVDMDPDDDIIAWVFLPSSDTVRRHPLLLRTSVVVFND